MKISYEELVDYVNSVRSENDISDSTKFNIEILKKIEVPYTIWNGNLMIDAEILLDFLTDDLKRNKAVSLLKNKAMW